MKTRLALRFTDGEKISKDADRTFPLVISANMLDHQVEGCLVDKDNPVEKKTKQ